MKPSNQFTLRVYDAETQKLISSYESSRGFEIVASLTTEAGINLWVKQKEKAE